MYYKKGFKPMAWLLVLTFLTVGAAQAYKPAQIVTSNKVGVYRDGKLVQVLQENAPVPEGALLKPEGNCGVRLQNLYLVAQAGSAFAVNQSQTPRMAVEKGALFFAANQFTGKTDFATPAGSFTVQPFIIHAAAEGMVKGFVKVDGANTTVGVLEGGSIRVTTASGDQVIETGNQIVLAQNTQGTQSANKSKSDAPVLKETSKVPKGLLVGGGIAAALGVGAIALSNDSGGGSSTPTPGPQPPTPVSPAAP